MTLKKTSLSQEAFKQNKLNLGCEILSFSIKTVILSSTCRADEASQPISYTEEDPNGDGIKGMRAVLKVFHQLNVMMKTINLQQHVKL